MRTSTIYQLVPEDGICNNYPSAGFGGVDKCDYINSASLTCFQSSMSKYLCDKNHERVDLFDNLLSELIGFGCEADIGKLAVGVGRSDRLQFGIYDDGEINITFLPRFKRSFLETKEALRSRCSAEEFDKNERCGSYVSNGYELVTLTEFIKNLPEGDSATYWLGGVVGYQY